MNTVPEAIDYLLEHGEFTASSLADELGVSRSVIYRWRDGTSRPRAVKEGQLRSMYSAAAQVAAVQASLPGMRAPTQADGKSALGVLLRELREILHRRGRLASRNEALDELSKLLFAHLMSRAHGGPGISRRSILFDAAATEAAARLHQFVNRSFSAHLPEALSHEMPPSDFDLRLKPQESQLALEVIDAFERAESHNALPTPQGTSAEDVLNEVFGSFLATSFQDEKELGQYLTPPEVVQFMVGLAIRDLPRAEFDLLCHPDHCADFGLILDPSCGVGSFLTEILRYLEPEVTKRHGSAKAKEWARQMVTRVLVGVDKSERMIRLALTSMAMFGAPAAMLHLANALAKSGPDASVTRALEGQASLILTNPPFGAEFQGADLLGYYFINGSANRRPPKAVSELLFMERYLDWLRPGGRLIAVIPDSILTNKGPFEVARRAIAEQAQVSTVVSLPAVTFGGAGTNTKTSVLHLQKRAMTEARHVTTYFAVCRTVGYDVVTRGMQRTKVPNGPSDLPLILEERFGLKHASPQGTWCNGVGGSERWDAAYHAALGPELKQALATDGLLRLSELAELVDRRCDPRRSDRPAFRYIEISDVDPHSVLARSKWVQTCMAPSRARKQVLAGDVLVSTVRPENRSVAVVGPDDDGAVCTTGFAVLRPKGANPVTLALLLKTDFVTAQLSRNVSGIAYPAIKEHCLLDVVVPASRTQLASLDTEALNVLDAEVAASHARRRFTEAMERSVSHCMTELREVAQ